MEIVFRPLRRSDFALLQQWLAAPHVTPWWNDPFDLPSLEAKYGPRIDGADPVHVYLIDYAGAPIGWIQWYRWSDFPEHANLLGADASTAGLDLAIGEFERTGRGLGPAVIREFALQHVFVHSDLTAILTDPDARNLRSLRAFQKAGFIAVKTIQGADGQRQIVRLDRNQNPNPTSNCD